MLIEAESHLDQAVTTGLDSADGFVDLAREYMQRNQDEDARRVAQRYFEVKATELWKTLREITGSSVAR